ncbi:hypothetical protein LOTGIDRAFT_104663, partial [Lottia gigantea]
KEKIYIDLQTQNACFRVLNATHQVGCSSKSGGNVGTLHYLESEEDYNWVLKSGPHTPYIVLITSLDFRKDNVERLVNTKRVNGILVLNILNNQSLSPIPTEGFSADKSCPNDNYGIYSNSSDYQHCKKVKWNAAGDGLYFKDYHDFPMFAISNVTDFNVLVDQCYRKFNKPINGTARSFPICAAQLNDRMDAAKDTITCIRRSNHMTNLKQTRYCDAMGDKNIVATTKMVDKSEQRLNKSVVVVSTRMDSFSMFEYEYQNSDTTVTGIVALLSAAKALRPVRQILQNASKDLMFTFFQGEAFDYIGSSRMVYEMEKNSFPYEIKDDVKSSQIVKLPSISHIIELAQLGHRDEGKLWIHTDPISRGSGSASEIEKMIKYIKDIGTEENVSLDDVGPDQPLPPASVQRFLKKANIPAIVLTDHKQQYTNKFYNSRLDLPDFINASYPDDLNETEKYDYVTEQAKALTHVSTVLAQFLYKLTTGEDITPNISQQIQADELEIAHLLYCFLENPVCELFKQSVSPEDSDDLTKKPFPFYVSVDSNTNQITRLTHSILAQYLGERLVNSTKDDCKQPDSDKVCHFILYNYLWMEGSIKSGSSDREGWCIKSTAILSKAQSPAFIIDNYDWLSEEYSTWTESVWSVFKVRVFLIPSESQKVLTFCVGFGILLVSLVVLYLLSISADILFMSAATSDSQPS